ncbi:hypothetical protein CONPUDRAFT_160799 [Coniophora puteana RWD-64-598 SS2]|uniref:Uncharacterized protein n=1 Tax=Coniophora puteana (strain RWD-64-598) TaxID=741705 RepID=R7SC49_CONPW|nr:uncharacterized protein CONPUDRAFT_160799 [Coniophora puteana RWD-64-598 SS2]EIW73723.1 hypothetical protein CONPUDRAFT_160799 [Coniophora puteana RWD-64-598 SS2]
MAMILLLILAHPRKIAIAVSPLKLLRQTHVNVITVLIAGLNARKGEELNSSGVRTNQINEDVPDNKELWNDIA